MHGNENHAASLKYNIRRARPDESGALSALAEMAKSYWGYSREQLALWADELRLTPESIASEPTFVAEHDGELAGVVQLCTTRPCWSLECLWVHPTAIRQGVGSLLIDQAVAYARAQGRAEIDIDADPNAEGFYLRLGARRVGEVRAPIDGEPGRMRPQLVLAIGETEHETELLSFLRAQRWAVEATSSTTQAPQAAIIGIAVSDALELVFDTLTTSRKAANLRANPRIALVIGGWSDSDPRTVQYEGIADFPAGADLERVQQTYFAAFPDGTTRLAWPDITYVRVKPTWVRYSDYRVDPPRIVELELSGGTDGARNHDSP